jgi:hypothetical protein
MLESIKSIDLYTLVNNLAFEKGFELNIFIMDKDSPFAETSNGTHDVDEMSKRINIGINPSVKDNLPIYIHELLHAKLYLTGYPKIYTYHSHRFAEGAEQALIEIENIAQHTLIYPEMKRLGYNQYEHDLHYLEGVRDDCGKTFEGPNKINRALRILEGYYRLPEAIDDIEDLIKQRQPKEYSLYMKMRRQLRNTKTPYTMRKSIANILAMAEEFVKLEENQEVFFRVLNKLTPYFSKYQLQQKASKTLYSIKFTSHEDVFLMGKSDNQCCCFINGNVLPVYKVNELLEKLTLKELLDYIQLEFGEV